MVQNLPPMLLKTYVKIMEYLINLQQYIHCNRTALQQKNRMLVEAAQCMLQAATLPSYFLG
jgi:hypothetical protein